MPWSNVFNGATFQEMHSRNVALSNAFIPVERKLFCEADICLIQIQFPFRDHIQISSLILSKFKWINELLFPLKLSKILWCFKGNGSWLINLNSLNIRSEIWIWSLTFCPDFPRAHCYFRVWISSIPRFNQPVLLPNKLLSFKPLALHKKWSFSLKISSVNVTKSADLVTFIEEILNGKLHFFVQCQ